MTVTSLFLTTGCIFLQASGSVPEQDLHCQPQGRAGARACQDQHQLVSFISSPGTASPSLSWSQHHCPLQIPLAIAASVFISACICVCGHMYAVCILVCVPVYWGQRLMCLPHHSDLIFLRQSLSLSLGLTHLIGLAGQWAPRTFLCLGLQACMIPDFLCGCWECQLRSSFLQGRQFINWVISLASVLIFNSSKNGVQCHVFSLQISFWTIRTKSDPSGC